jgi:hypothetical protein
VFTPVTDTLGAWFTAAVTSTRNVAVVRSNVPPVLLKV